MVQHPGAGSQQHWKRITNCQGGAGRVTEAPTRVFPEQIGDHQKLWNLPTAYELWSGHILTCSALVVVQDGLSSVLEPGREVQLQRTKMALLRRSELGGTITLVVRRQLSPGSVVLSRQWIVFRRSHLRRMTISIWQTRREAS